MDKRKYNQYIMYKDLFIVVVEDVNQWPARSMQHKGWIGPYANLIASRDMTKQEIEDAKNQKRCYACKYTSWKKLIEDEKKLNAPAEFIKNLTELSEKLKLNNQEVLFKEEDIIN